MRNLTQPRSKIIHRHLLALLHETSISALSFAATVREFYEDTTAAHHRDVEFSTHTDLVTRMKRDAERLLRWFDPTVQARLPADLENAIVLAFPLPRRQHLEAELAAGRGLLAVPMPSNTTAPPASALADYLRQSGEALAALAPIFADGVIDHRDIPYTPCAVVAIDEVMAMLAGIRQQLVDVRAQVSRT